jgi:hypothetical protein
LSDASWEYEDRRLYNYWFSFNDKLTFLLEDVACLLQFFTQGKLQPNHMFEKEFYFSLILKSASQNRLSSRQNTDLN